MYWVYLGIESHQLVYVQNPSDTSVEILISLKEELQQLTDRDEVEKELCVIRRKIHNIYKLAEEVDDENGILVLQMRLKDPQELKHDSEAMIHTS